MSAFGADIARETGERRCYKIFQDVERGSHRAAQRHGARAEDVQAAIDWLMAAKVRASNVIPRKHVIMRGFAGFLPLPHLLPFSG